MWRAGDGQALPAPECPGARAAVHGVGIAWLLASVGAATGGGPGRGEPTGPGVARRRDSLPCAIAAIGALVTKPPGAAGIARGPAHRNLMRGTPARVVFGRAGEALGCRRLGRRRRGARLRAVAVVA